MGPDKAKAEIRTIDRATDRKDPGEIASIAARTFVAMTAEGLQSATEQKLRTERDRKGVPLGKCLKCRKDIGPEVLSLNPNAPNCQPCNLADLRTDRRKKNLPPQMRVAALAIH